MSSSDIFGFLNDVWDLLPEQDRNRFGELWRAYEQTYGDIWTRVMESNLASNIDYIPLYNNQRWIKHQFDSTTLVNRAASFNTTQDLTRGLDLSQRHLIKFAIDGGSPVELDLRGSNPAATSGQEIVSRINSAVGFQFAKLIGSGALIQLSSRTSGPSSQITFLVPSVPSMDASPLVLGLSTDELPKVYPKYPYAYRLVDRFIVSIPVLQDKIHPEAIAVELAQGADYEVEFGTGIISFAVPPSTALWSRDNFINKESPYYNFGYLLDIYDSNSPAYLKAVRGLWFAFWTGPRPEYIRRSLYLLFGLPAASQAGTVTAASPSTVSLLYVDGSSETFAVPTDLVPEVTVGQQVERFQPLVSGIVVLDKINSPGFIKREAGRHGIQPFLTEDASRGEGPDTDETRALRLVEENTYLPQIDVNTFISPDIKLANVRTFLRNIQPKSRTFLFQVLVGTFKEQISLIERIGQDLRFSVDPNLDLNPNLDMSDSEREAAETGGSLGAMLDSEGFTFSDSADIEVMHAGVLVDSLQVEG